MLEILGYTLVGLVGLALTLTYPFSEFARGMATNPAAHEKSKGGCFASLIGLALLGWMAWDIWS